MKLRTLALCLLLSPTSASAALCSVAPEGTPCTPDPGPETDWAKDNIKGFIKHAQGLEPFVQQLRAEYLAVRDSSASDENKLEACRKYFAAVAAQEQSYQEAMDQTQRLYHVKPDKQSRIAIAEPSDPEMGYVTGLSALWNPRVTDSGAGVKLAVRIDGNDGKRHYSGATQMDPRNPGGRQAFTLADGRVLVLKDTFDIALKKDNPGYLARVLYHETRHFNRLSWRDDNGKARGWEKTDKEELAAYTRDLKMAKVFGLDEKDIADLRKNKNDYAAAVSSGIPLNNDRLTPQEEAVWKDHYEHKQVNIEEEFTALTKKVDDARRRQEALQKRLAEERLAREKAEAERIEKEKWRQLDDMAARCGYTVAFQKNTGEWLGFKRVNEYMFFKSPYKTALLMNDIEMALLVANTCFDVHLMLENRIGRPSGACNSSASMLSAAVSQPGFSAKMDYIFGPQRIRGECINSFLAHAAELTDTAKFDKFAEKYGKQAKKDAEEADRRWHPKGWDRKERPEEPRRAPRDDSRDDSRKSPDHDEVWRRINPIFR